MFTYIGIKYFNCIIIKYRKREERLKMRRERERKSKKERKKEIITYAGNVCIHVCIKKRMSAVKKYPSSRRSYRNFSKLM